jgi:hypothetical protein
MERSLIWLLKTNIISDPMYNQLRDIPHWIEKLFAIWIQYRIKKLQKSLVFVLLPKSIKLQSQRRLYTISLEFAINLKKFHSICGKRPKNRKIVKHQYARAKVWVTPRTSSSRMDMMRQKLWKLVNQSLGTLVWTEGWSLIMSSV